MMKEYIFEELGYFTENECKAIKEVMDGKTFMDFKVTYSSFAGNCTLIVKTDYEECTEDEIKSHFIASALSMISRIKAA